MFKYKEFIKHNNIKAFYENKDTSDVMFIFNYLLCYNTM